MAWIEVHQALPRHRKTIAVAMRLGIPPEAVAGHLVALWLWAVDNAKDGVIPQNPQMIDMAAGCPVDVLRTSYGCPENVQHFSELLVQEHWIDETSNGWELHDWYDYAGKLSDRREADAKRKREERAAKKTAESKRKTSAGRPPLQYPTVPYPTQHDKSTPLTPKGEYTCEFESFWAIYPKKIDKRKAFRCWNARLKAGHTAEDMIAAAKHYATATAGSKYIKNPATFIGPDEPFTEFVTEIPAAAVMPGGNGQPAYVEDEHDIWMRETREKIASGEYVPEPPPPITDGWSR